MRSPRVPGWVAPAALYAVALAARLALADSRPYGDEAHHYYIAREFGAPPGNIVGGTDTHWLFWWRPLFSLLLAPGAQVSFDAFRVNYILLAAALAPVLFWWLRGRGVGMVASIAGGAVVALHPYFVVWGVRAFPDALMATLFIAGLALWERGRIAWGAGLLLAATWTKEVALIGVLVLCAEEFATQVRWADRHLALRLGARHFLLLGVAALAWLPHLYANTLGGRFPGWSRGGSVGDVLDGAFTTALLIPAVVACLFSRNARRPALYALSYLGFYLAYHLVRGGRTESWYFVLPAALAVAALAAGIDQLAKRAKASEPRPKSVSRWAHRAAVAGVIALLAAQLFLPGASAVKQDLLNPGAGADEMSVAEVVRYERERDQDFWTTLDAARPEDWRGVLMVDVGWFFALWPFSDRADALGLGFTGGYVGSAAPWADAIERNATMTFLHREATALNQAVRETYASCIGFETPEYMIIRGMACPGRAAQLQMRWDRLRASS